MAQIDHFLNEDRLLLVVQAGKKRLGRIGHIALIDGAVDAVRRLDHQRLLIRPIPLLSERVPEVIVIEAGSVVHSLVANIRSPPDGSEPPPRSVSDVTDAFRLEMVANV